jgi:hypothetical protein
MKPGPDGIDSYNVAALVRSVEVYRFYDKELFAVESFVFLG